MTIYLVEDHIEVSIEFQLKIYNFRAANLQNMLSVICWKNFRIFNNFSVSLNLFLSRLKTVIMATSYLLWWDPLAPSGNSSGFFRYYRNRKWGRACVTTTCGREKNGMFWWLKRYLKVLRHKIPQIFIDLLPKTGKLCSGSSTLCDRTDRAQFPYFEGQIRTPVFCM